MTPDPTIISLLAAQRPLLSVEFFPPKNEAGGQEILRTAAAIREEVQPDFVSITYGAGGTTRERTFRYARLLREEYGFRVMPHLTCVGHSRDELRAIIGEYVEQGFRNIMALRGDPPKGVDNFTPHPEGLGYGSELVAFIQEEFPEVCLGAGAYPEVHPEAPDAAADLRHLKVKVDAGAHFLTTQLFYDNANFQRFVDQARASGIHVPILPGLMPLRSATQARRFCQHIPAELDAQLIAHEGDATALAAVGVQWCHRQMVDLLAHGAPGVHLYIMNRSGAVRELVQQLRADGLFQR